MKCHNNQLKRGEGSLCTSEYFFIDKEFHTFLKVSVVLQSSAHGSHLHIDNKRKCLIQEANKQL